MTEKSSESFSEVSSNPLDNFVAKAFVHKRVFVRARMMAAPASKLLNQNIVVKDLIMPCVIALYASAHVHEILRDVVVGASIIIIDTPPSPIVGDDEILDKRVICRQQRGLAGAHVC